MTAAPDDDLRLHAPAAARPRAGGEFVLYWMQTTMRAHDNFALNYAIARADELGLPVLVYHGLRHDYPWASDRFHTWILESVADLYADFEAKGIQYAFWLDRARGEYTEWPAGRRTTGSGKREAGSGTARSTSGSRFPRPDSPTPLVALARRAALVVTDYFPTFIVPRQLRGLREKVETPVIAVDSCTVVPLRYHQKEHSTARGIRPVLMEALPHYLWPVANPEPRVRARVPLEFEPTVIRDTGSGQREAGTGRSIAEVVAGCDVDHGVPPSTTFRGGTRAGRARLADFLKTGLPRYTEDRNDPNQPDAVSRLSPWLHFGNLSIHEILLAVQRTGPGDQVAKFLDEALVWRELAHNFCHWNPKHRTVEAIPGWARQQLSDHEADPRPHLYGMEEMEQARTAEPLWNAAQRSYLTEGFMHNYMRMLWGKTVLQWTANAAECLRVLEHLNNKYALDGRDPNSYGGILWIFGKFDRPFYPRPIYGLVRYQSLKAAKDKFDVGRYVGRYS
ncbi:MAG: deoxyribodipyrimidine photo-lyase [Gemmatimonadales bacterium]|nr:deoxyribodipyrimidine photo-lyase [Gemmatimonadales bacterium]